jgi:putative phosphoribosyl transferase
MVTYEIIKSDKMVREEVQINLMGPIATTINGILQLPEHTKALVIHAYGIRKSDDEEHHLCISKTLNSYSIATLYIGLLTAPESAGAEEGVNSSLLGDRLVQVTQWVMEHPQLRSFPIGYFGDDTGVAIALHAAALLDKSINGVVCTRGHPELAKNALSKIKSPLLLIVGEKNSHSVYMHQIAYDHLRTQRKLLTLAGVLTFEETGVWKKVAQLAADWMDEHLVWPGMNTVPRQITT